MENVQSAWSKMGIIPPRYQGKRSLSILEPVGMNNAEKGVPHQPIYFLRVMGLSQVQNF